MDTSSSNLLDDVKNIFPFPHMMGENRINIEKVIKIYVVGMKCHRVHNS